jgi:hypothetical protein
MVPSVERGERRHVAQRVQAAGIERLGIGLVDELAEQARHAAGIERAMALAAGDQARPLGRPLSTCSA